MQSAVQSDLRADAHCRIMELHPILKNPELSVKVTSNAASNFVPCATSTPAQIRNNPFKHRFEPSPIAAANFCYEKRHSAVWNMSTGAGFSKFNGHFVNSQCHPRRATICPLPRSAGNGFSRHGMKELAILSGSEDDDLLLPRKSLRPSKKGRAKTNCKSFFAEKQQDVLCRRTSEVVWNAYNIAPLYDQQFDPATPYFNQVIQESEHKVLSWFEKNSRIDNKQNHEVEEKEDKGHNDFIENEKQTKQKRKQNCNSNDVEIYQCKSRAKKIKVSDVQVSNNHDLPMREVTNLTHRINRQKKGITSRTDAFANCVEGEPVAVMGKKRVNNRARTKPDRIIKIGEKAQRAQGVKVADCVESNNGCTQPAEKQTDVQMSIPEKLKYTPDNLNLDNAEIKSEVMIIDVEPDLIRVPGRKVNTRRKVPKGTKESEKVIKPRSIKKSVKTKSEVANDMVNTPCRLPCSNVSMTKSSRMPPMKKSAEKTISKVAGSLNSCSTKDRTSLQNPVLPTVTSFNNIDNWKEVQGKNGVVFCKLAKNNIMSSGLIKLLPQSILAKNTCSMQVFTVVQGTGEVKFVDFQKKTKPGDVIYLPVGSEYTIKNVGRKEFVISYVKLVTPKLGSEEEGSHFSAQLGM